MSTLFGHTRGSFTGALKDRPELLRTAHDGILFLDEIGELGLDEQAMRLRALEEKTFLPLGADREVRSSFQWIAGTNRDLLAAVRERSFREDLLARINLWTFTPPGLANRREDIEPNLDYELAQFTRRSGRQIRFDRTARRRFLDFAHRPETTWNGNFRDLNAAVARMATPALVKDELSRLKSSWGAPARDLLQSFFNPQAIEQTDRFEQMQLSGVLTLCLRHKSLSAAGRELFGVSRTLKATPNDADRLRKYLQRYGIRWEDVERYRRQV